MALRCWFQNFPSIALCGWAPLAVSGLVDFKCNAQNRNVTWLQSVIYYGLIG